MAARRGHPSETPSKVFVRLFKEPEVYYTSLASGLMIFTLFDNLMVRIECKIRRARATIGNQRLLFGRGDPSGFLLLDLIETMQ